MAAVPPLYRTILSVIIFFVLCPSAVSFAGCEAVRSVATSPALPRLFIPNQGQFHSHVAFTARLSAGKLVITKRGELVYAVSDEEDGRLVGMVVRESFPGDKTPEIRGVDKAESQVSYFTGSDPSKWKSGLPTYAAISMEQPFEGVDLELKLAGGSMEKVFTVAPHADPGTIRMAVDGADQLERSESGELVCRSPHGSITFSRPVAYQEIDGIRVVVDAAYDLQGCTYGFTIVDYVSGHPRGSGFQVAAR